MKSVLFAVLLGLVAVGCSTTPRGGTSDVYQDSDYDYGWGSSVDRQNEFGRGTDRFSQESTQMLPGAEPDVRTFRQ